MGDLPAGITWSRDFEAVAGLTAAASGLVASVVSGTKKYLVGIDAKGHLQWRREVPHRALLVPGKQWAFAAMRDRILRIDPKDGRVGATREVDPPVGGWTRETTLCIGDDLLIAGAQGLERLRGSDLATLWKVSPRPDEDDEGIQQLAYVPPWTAAVSNHVVTVISERGEAGWARRLPADTRLAGTSPLVMAADRVWVGLVRVSDPAVRFLYGLSVSDGRPGPETPVSDLAMFCPGYASSGVLVLDTQRGVAGFDVEHDLRRLWSVEAPVATGLCLPQDGHLLIATRTGELLRVAFANGEKRTLLRLPQRLTWAPPAPDLTPGVHYESAGAIEHLAVLPGGLAFSVSWSSDQAAIQFRPW